MGITKIRQGFFLALYLLLGTYAQFEDNPVTWDVEVVQGEDNAYEIRFEASITEGWYIYSQDNDPSAGPIPTTIQINENADIVLDGEVKSKRQRI